jgi:hypothetical protein
LGALLFSGGLFFLQIVSGDDAKFIAELIFAPVCFSVAAWWVTAFWKMRGLTGPPA